MPPKSRRYLEHIDDAVGFILEIGEGKSPEEYEANRMLRQTIERNFEIIGEAVTRIERDDPSLAQRITHHRQIVGFRNVLIHGYDTVDARQVLRVIEQDLPRLRDEVRSLLRETTK